MPGSNPTIVSTPVTGPDDGGDQPPLDTSPGSPTQNPGIVPVAVSPVPPAVPPAAPVSAPTPAPGSQISLAQGGNLWPNWEGFKAGLANIWGNTGDALYDAFVTIEDI
jgi:hypothetical protein